MDFATAANAPREHNPEAFFNVAEQVESRMGDFLERLDAISTRLCGPLPPQAEAKGDIRGVPSGHFEAAADAGRRTMLKLEQAARLLSRIESKL